MKYIRDLKEVNSSDIDLVGGKNASTGEMLQALTKEGIHVPRGFAITVNAYKDFLKANELDQIITDILSSLNKPTIKKLDKASRQIQKIILKASFMPELEDEIVLSYADMKSPTVAVRSSATTEDLAYASFAGAQDSYLNIKGIKHVLMAVKLVYASLFNSRAIDYRIHHGFQHDQFALSVGIQQMVRSDKGASGVIFTMDTETGFDKVIMITSTYGLGEAIVQGQVNPDEFIIYKPIFELNKFAILQRKLGDKAIKMVYTLSSNPKKSIKTVAVKEHDRLRFSIEDHDIQILAQQALIIEKHYGKPMDIEWAKDGVSGKIYIVQARPETVKSRVEQSQTIERYTLTMTGKTLVEGQSVGQKINHGKARIIADPKQMHTLQAGEILVTDMTDPDWEPVMRRAAGIVTNRGGRTCHAAIVARELGIPAIVGCVNATTSIKQLQPITVSCAEGQTGYVYEGELPFTIDKIAVDELPALPVKLCLNVGNPDRAFSTQFLPNHGVGLARLEFLISNMIGIHPNALLQLNVVPRKIKQEILKKTAAYKNPVEFYIERLREGISMIAAAFYPKQVIFRFSDFKTNEYANLLGGDQFEPHEENPMLGYRGASRYYDERFRRCFELECKAFKRVRDGMGLTNAQIMIPFVRTVDECSKVIKLMQDNGLERGKNNLKVYMMCEIPSNALLAKEFLNYVDGFSIGSNDLTQLTLGLDRDSNQVAALFDERNPAVKALLHLAINECIQQGKYIGICGQGPSDHPDFAEWLMHEGIQSISLNPDSIVETWTQLAETLQRSYV